MRRAKSSLFELLVETMVFWKKTRERPSVPRVQFTFSSPVLLTLCLISGGLLFSAKFSHEAMSLLPLSYYRWDRPTVGHLRLLSWPLAHADFQHFFHNYKMILLLGAPVEGESL